MLDFVSSISVLIAALTFIAGVSAWKREFVGKRRIELAESVLALFYEAEDAIKRIRSPFSFESEGGTRKHADNELKAESRILDQAYVVFERHQKREKLFAQIRSMRYRVMAAFGSSAAEPFDELNKIINEILLAARMLGDYYWQRQGRVEMVPEEFKKHLEEMHSYEAVFRCMNEDKDKISPRVRKVVENIESITQAAFVTQDSILSDVIDDIRNSITKRKKPFRTKV